MDRRLHSKQPLDYYEEPEDNLTDEELEKSFKKHPDYHLIDLLEDEYLEY